jgi:hypothetical protein
MPRAYIYEIFAHDDDASGFLCHIIFHTPNQGVLEQQKYESYQRAPSVTVLLF